MDLNTIVARIREGGWVSAELRSQVKMALVRQLGHADEATPLCVLTAKRYRGIDTSDCWQWPRQKVGSLALIGGAEDPLASSVTAILPKAEPFSAENSETVRRYEDALALVRVSDLAASSELARSIEFIATIDTNDYRSCSSPHALGCLVLTTRALASGTADLATSLVHELAHQELFVVNLFDRIVPPAADEKTSYAPFQQRTRPAIGRLHSLAALSRMVAFRRRAGVDVERFEQLLTDTRDSLGDDVLTTFGRSLRDAYVTGAFA